MELIVLLILFMVYKLISNPNYKRKEVQPYKIRYNDSLRKKGIIEDNILQENNSHSCACNNDFNDCGE